jgi:hypothetical protein
MQSAFGKRAVAGLEGQSLAKPTRQTHIVPQINANNDKFISLMLPGWINNQTIEFLVDSGSTVSIISPRVLGRIDSGTRPVIVKTDEGLTMADGSDVPTHGRAGVNLKFGTLDFYQNVLVADIQCDGILGNDFLKAKGCKIDYQRGCVRIENKEILYRETGGGSTASMVQVSQTVTLAPGEQAIISAKVKRHDNMAREGLIEPIQNFVEKTGVMVGKVLVNGSHETVPLRVVNLGNEHRTVYKSTNIGLYHPIECI